MKETLKEVQDKIIPILERHGVIRAGLFGSLIREGMESANDVDILVELQPDKSLLDV